MKLRLFERFHGAKSEALLVGLQHDPLALLDFELEDMPERFQDMLHAVRVVVVQQYFIPRHVDLLAFSDGSGLC
jgi:hypothetical protein